MNTILILKIAAVTHSGLLAAGLLMPSVVGLHAHLRTLPEFIRKLFWVYYGFIGFCLVSFGVGTFFLAGPLTSGTPLARSACGFLAVFWTIRFIVGTFVFNLQPYLTSAWRRTGLILANIVFTCLPLIYGWVALRGGSK